MNRRANHITVQSLKLFSLYFVNYTSYIFFQIKIVYCGEIYISCYLQILVWGAVFEKLV
jgi:hypothetical protein